MATKGEMTMGAIIATMMLNGRVLAPVSKIVGMIIKYDKTMISLNNIDELMNMPVEKQDKAYISRPNIHGDIELKDVDFSYKDQNFKTLKNINLRINQGEKGCNLRENRFGEIYIVKSDIKFIRTNKWFSTFR